MKTRYFLKLSYKGTNYHGWQIQDNANTVQQEVNAALSTVLNEPIQCTGCGRTDTGVHATEFYAHFDAADEILTGSDVIFKLNGCLPPDISIQKLLPVQPESNTRFDATARTYEYYITQTKDPFLQEQACFLFGKLDVEAMNRAAQALLDYTDFSSFSKSGTQVKTNLCTISEALWIANNQRLTFRITADRFLRGMVRAIVGTLLEVGRGKLSLADFKEIIEAKDRTKAGYSVPAAGLHLTSVVYPKELFISQHKSTV